ncbi:MAG: HAD family hydrolase [Gammaproteobacteria bacterium]|nr:HAD family hydrolase [Gammaproteobacteria bacterium]
MKVPANLKLITFDLDDTLWPCMPVIMRAEKALHSWLMQHAPRLAETHGVKALREHRKSIAAQRPEISHNLTLTRQISLQILLEQAGHNGDLSHQAIEIFRHERNKVTPYDDVIPVLKHLATSYQLIAVTNGNADITQTPLDGYFQHALTAEAVGASRPDTAIFNEAMRLADVSPEQTLHVGDDPRTDIEAAYQLGIHNIWLNRHQRQWPEEQQRPHHEINQLDQLLLLLKD